MSEVDESEGARSTSKPKYPKEFFESPDDEDEEEWAIDSEKMNDDSNIFNRIEAVTVEGKDEDADLWAILKPEEQWKSKKKDLDKHWSQLRWRALFNPGLREAIGENLRSVGIKSKNSFFTQLKRFLFGYQDCFADDMTIALIMAIIVVMSSAGPVIGHFGQAITESDQMDMTLVKWKNGTIVDPSLVKEITVDPQAFGKSSAQASFIVDGSCYVATTIRIAYLGSGRGLGDMALFLAFYIFVATVLAYQQRKTHLLAFAFYFKALVQNNVKSSIKYMYVLIAAAYFLLLAIITRRQIFSELACSTYLVDYQREYPGAVSQALNVALIVFLAGRKMSVFYDKTYDWMNVDWLLTGKWMVREKRISREWFNDPEDNTPFDDIVVETDKKIIAEHKKRNQPGLSNLCGLLGKYEKPQDCYYKNIHQYRINLVPQTVVEDAYFLWLRDLVPMLERNYPEDGSAPAPGDQVEVIVHHTSGAPQSESESDDSSESSDEEKVDDIEENESRNSEIPGSVV